MAGLLGIGQAENHRDDSFDCRRSDGVCFETFGSVGKSAGLAQCDDWN